MKKLKINAIITLIQLNNQKAEYGKAVIKKLSEKLTIEYDRGYSRANLFRMLKFYEYFTDFEKFSTLSKIMYEGRI